MYGDNMNDLSKNIPVNTPEQNIDDYKNKRQILLTCIGVKWYTNNIRARTYHLKRPILSNETKKGRKYK